ncbi:MAG TPA: nitronate monooxygenase [Candidatus Elarobacter sp.]|nr:nitronate monooxygenase [Candidatus Elarobacter sp.]
MLTTPLCRRLGIMHPVLCAGMGGLIAGPALAAAVSSAGGLGVLGLLGVPAPLIADAIRAVRALTDRPFGVNVVLAGMTRDDIDICLAERVPVIVSFWGDPSSYVAAAHERGTIVFAQVGSVAEAIAAVEAGVDGVIAQGVEAGGHVRGTTALSVLLPAVRAAVHPIPVIAAGGVADGRGVAAALALGAQAVSMGTRFLASNEAAATDAYKARIVAAVAEDTVLTSLFDLGWPDAPHRALRNRTVARWEAAGRPPSGSRPGEGDVIGRAPFGGAVVDLPRYSVVPPIAGYEGDVEDAVLYAGESCTLVHDVRPAAEIVRAVVEEAAAILGR